MASTRSPTSLALPRTTRVLEPPGLTLVQHVQPLRHVAHQLHLHGAALHIRKAALQKHGSLVHDAHMVADVLNSRRLWEDTSTVASRLAHIGKQNAPHLPPHYRVQAVHRLVRISTSGRRHMAR